LSQPLPGAVFFYGLPGKLMKKKKKNFWGAEGKCCARAGRGRAGEVVEERVPGRKRGHVSAPLLVSAPQQLCAANLPTHTDSSAPKKKKKKKKMKE
jgi:hypothetical protein